METKFVIMSVGFIFCLIASFSILAFLNRSERINARPRLKQILPSFTLIAVFGLSSLATVWIIPEFDDFISPLTHASPIPENTSARLKMSRADAFLSGLQ